MAIGPKQLSENFMKEVSDFEKRIDSVLTTKRVAPGGMITIDVPSTMTSDHFNILRRRYVDAGWAEVKMQHDQREGSWIEFRS
jgi:hypothetical protein